ncbi:MAG: hypothetical protein GWN07_37205, partial [Actinobacteria bacterium]|nr:hypothetical protein [Actinomycetota bacterium]NIU71047.1 hypothetical protein [Actinomycetota bacterium]NIV90546.1 hypothetical protein [Actinomycetota bacterium]NIW32992.1 hypothetical protein [Actinomycetota bacterium]NIX25138.1 hypothetical protein [Actinomycetota bacterium]
AAIPEVHARRDGVLHVAELEPGILERFADRLEHELGDIDIGTLIGMDGLADADDGDSVRHLSSVVMRF